MTNIKKNKNFVDTGRKNKNEAAECLSARKRNHKGITDLGDKGSWNNDQAAECLSARKRNHKGITDLGDKESWNNDQTTECLSVRKRGCVNSVDEDYMDKKNLSTIEYIRPKTGNQEHFYNNFKDEITRMIEKKQKVEAKELSGKVENCQENIIGESLQIAKSDHNVNDNDICKTKSTAQISNTKEMETQPAYELAKRFRRCNYIFMDSGTLRVYRKGAYVPIDLCSYHMLIEQMLTSGEIIMKRRPTVKEIKDSYAHLYAELSGNKISLAGKIKEDENKMVFQNGIFDTVKQEIKPLSHKYIAFIPLRVKYLHDKRISTPVFDGFIQNLDVTGQEFSILKELLLNVLGYISIGNHSGKCFFYLAPAMNSGKSLLAKFIQEIFPEEMVSTESMNDLNQRFAMADIEKKAICISMDLTGTTLSKDAIARIKNITGDRRVTVEQKYMPKKTVVHNCKFLFGSNHSIKISGTDPAFWERVVLIPFIKSIPREKQDMNLVDKLLKEKNEIMTLAARSVKRLIDNKFIFPETSIAKFMKNKWMGNVENSVMEFVEHRCELQTDSYEFTIDLYDQYRKFCNDFSREPIVKTEFAKEIVREYKLKQGKRRKHGNPRNGFFGIKIKDTISEK